ncbi:hypothetical protein K438DRAFT_700728 [Mycena galopus ATCC 62051]|nr:hypothetical protein K438DRAFT_700728 [Mycena galopus ATCC 62051]
MFISAGTSFIIVLPFFLPSRPMTCPRSRRVAPLPTYYIITAAPRLPSSCYARHHHSPGAHANVRLYVLYCASLLSLPFDCDSALLALFSHTHLRLQSRSFAFVRPPLHKVLHPTSKSVSHNINRKCQYTIHIHGSQLTRT